MSVGDTLTPVGDQYQEDSLALASLRMIKVNFLLSTSDQRYVIQYGELGI